MIEEKTEFCWSCHQQKPTSQIDMTEGQFTSGICKDCQTNLETSLKNNGVRLIQKDRPPQYSHWYDGDVIIRDIFVEKNGQTYFIRGFHICERPYETAEVFNLVKQFIHNCFRWVRFYGDLETLRTHDFWFHVSKSEQFYHFGGNCQDISNAFSLKTVDINQIFSYIEAWTKIPDRLKQNIASQLDKGLTFASSPEPFSRDKAFCFKEYHKDSRDPKVMILRNINQIPKTT